jgi:hypothetical protein
MYGFKSLRYSPMKLKFEFLPAVSHITRFEELIHSHPALLSSIPVPANL